jgi:XRE family transcriptional regulator, regulator of sulfur utilization
MATGEGATPPAGVVAVGAEVRRLRQGLGVSLSELARRAGVGKATLSGIESGVRNPTLDTLFAVTAQLQVPLGAVLEGAGSITTSGDAVDAVLLHRAVGPVTAVETYRLRVRPVEQRSAAHRAGTVETLVVLDGRVRTGTADATVVLGPGEHHTFAADLPHLYAGLDEGASCLLVMSTPVGSPG